MTKRTFVVEGIITTVALEDAFWQQLEKVAKDNEVTVAELVALVEDSLGTDNRLSSALRTYLSVAQVRH